MFQLVEKRELSNGMAYTYKDKDYKLKIFWENEKITQAFLTRHSFSFLGLGLSLDISNKPYIHSQFPLTVIEEYIPELKEFLRDYDIVRAEIAEIFKMAEQGIFNETYGK